MNVSLNWLKEYVEIPNDLTIEKIVHKLTMSGSKVEKWEQFGEVTKGVYTAVVEDVTPHSEDDKLYILTLNLGDKKAKAVAKIADIEVGDIVPVALPGATVIGKEIKVGEVKGIKSECMICHILDLGLSKKDFPWVKPSGLISFPKDVPIGEDINNILGLGDYVIEFEITPNRPDCLSIEGIAREFAVTFGLEYKKLWQETSPNFNKVKNVENLEVKIISDNCNRYMLNVANDVKVMPSPYEIQIKLIKAGIRPINNIVDITNFVMLELGQPIHTFDYDKLEGNSIIVRQATADEQIKTLDGVDRKLNENDLVIADEKVPVAIAGVIGGEDSGINLNTKKVVVEVANFVRRSIRNTSRKEVVRTDASTKNEKGLAPELVSYAMNRACDLLNKISGGNIDFNVVDEYPNIQTEVKIKLDFDVIRRIIGENISDDKIIKILQDLKFEIVDSILKVPYFRQDINILEDIAEEVARIYGYDKLKSKLPNTALTFGGKTLEQKSQDKLKDLLIASGFNEIYTYTFFAKELLTRMEVPENSELRNCIKVKNPLSQEFEYMRTTAMPLMLEALERNYTKKNDNVKLFELGKIFLDADNLKENKLATEKLDLTLGVYDTSNKVDFYDIKSTVEILLKTFKISLDKCDISRYTEDVVYHPGMSAKLSINNDTLAVFGKLSPKVCKNYILPENTYIATIDYENVLKYANNNIKFIGLPKFPAVERDIAFIVETDVLSGKLAKDIKITNDLVESVELFDIYEGKQIEEGKKSMAYKIKLRSNEKTLEEIEITKAMENIVNMLEEKYKAIFRK